MSPKLVNIKKDMAKMNPSSSNLLRHFITSASFLLLFITTNPSCNAEFILYSGETLSSGSSLTWGGYGFVMQEDCNLVLYDNGNPVWATDTGGLASNCYCTLQSDGNLVVYDGGSNPIWASNTGRESGGYYVLILQKDRNVVLYGGAIWATDTHVDTVMKQGGGGMMSAVKINVAPNPTNKTSNDVLRTVVEA